MQQSNGKLIKPAEYAKLRGLNKSTIARQIASGVIPTTGGKVDPAAADQARAASLKRRSGGVVKAAAVEVPAPKGRETTAEAACRKEIALADLREFEAGEKRGKLLDYDEINLELAGLVLAFREAALALPSQLQDRLAAISDPVKVGLVLEDEIRRVLTNLSDYKPGKRRKK